MKRIAILAVAAVTTFGIGCNTDRRANTADNPAVGTAGRMDVSRADRDFVGDLTITNMAEIELGRMAAERAANAEVKRFGQTMVDDHTAAGNKLKPIATEHSIPMPADLDDKHRDLRERLSKLQGAEFDREYMKAMVDGHEDVLAKLESRIDKERLAEYKAKYRTVTPAAKRRRRHQGGRVGAGEERRSRHDKRQPVGGRLIPGGLRASAEGQGAQRRGSEGDDQLGHSDMEGAAGAPFDSLRSLRAGASRVGQAAPSYMLSSPACSF